MITVAKGMAACTALIALCIASAIDLAISRPTTASPAAVVAERFPAAHEAFGQLQLARDSGSLSVGATVRKGDRLSTQADCAGQPWPYIARQCLVSRDGSPLREVSRVVTVERRIGPDSSALVRVPVDAVVRDGE
jgi:hypothetical protein